MRPVIESMHDDPRLVVSLLVSRADERIDVADLSSLAPLVSVGDARASVEPAELARVDGLIARDVARWLERAKPDLLVLLGDRHELLAVALAATLARVPIVHLHGGDITEGAFDDSIRHAVTKLSHLHCTGTADSAERIIGMGEEPWRVQVTGAPGLDAVQRAVPVDLATLLGCVRHPVALVTYHPPTATPERLQDELAALLAALETIPSVIVTAPGPDPGADEIRSRLEAWVAAVPGRVFVANLGEGYPGVLRSVDVVVGNSSSGIVEAPSARVPVVNIGARQNGRPRADGVLDAPTASKIDGALRRALSDDHRERTRAAVNPYGDGASGKRIAELVATAPLDRLLLKRYVDVEHRAVR